MYAIRSYYVRIKYFSLVNIVMGRGLVKEFLQFRLAKKIRAEMDRIFNQPQYRSQLIV